MTRRQLHGFLRLLVASIIAALAMHFLNRCGVHFTAPVPTP